jgi:hypothetical protein
VLSSGDYHVTQAGGGLVTTGGPAIRLELPPSDNAHYHNAQISTYRTRRDFDQRPPLALTVRAYVEGESIQGTAGFGFWNHPYAPGERGFRLPKALWFFYGAPPNDMALALDVPGHGWKAATFDATRWPFLALLPAALPGFLLMRIPALYRWLWPFGQRAIGVSETPLDADLLRQPHEYRLEWHPDRVVFKVDGGIVHESQQALRGPLGFVAWIDNQYAIVTPRGRFGSGLVAIPTAQALIIESLEIAPLTAR